MYMSAFSIPHKSQRYETVGDWKTHTYDGPGTLSLTAKVSEMKNWRYEALVGIHELVEGLLCFSRDIKEEDVTAFDETFEANRVAGDEREPGDQPEAPYHKEHTFATKIEKMLAEELGVDWAAYEAAINAL